MPRGKQSTAEQIIEKVQTDLGKSGVLEPIWSPPLRPGR
jgi:hypothetical protein